MVEISGNLLNGAGSSPRQEDRQKYQPYDQERSESDPGDPWEPPGKSYGPGEAREDYRADEQGEKDPEQGGPVTEETKAVTSPLVVAGA